MRLWNKDKSQLRDVIDEVEHCRYILENLGINYPNQVGKLKDEYVLSSEQIIDIARTLYKAEVLCINPRFISKW